MTNSTLMRAILAMDAYNRGAGIGVNLPNDSVAPGTKIGDAAIIDSYRNSSTGFYAVAYQIGSEIVISYQGTNEASDLLSWFGGGSLLTGQALDAAQFYKSVVATLNLGTIYDANVSFTGHSLGGGLAGLMASLYGKSATVFDDMAFEAAALRIYRDASNPVDPEGSGDVLNPLHDIARSGFYLDTDPKVIPNAQLVNGYQVAGQALQGWQSLPGVVLDPGDAELGALAPKYLHDVSLLVTLLYAQQNFSTAGWGAIKGLVVESLFDDRLASAAGIADALTLRTQIAYSAIGGSVGLVSGSAAIAAMVRDSEELGTALTSNLGSLSNIRDSLNHHVGLALPSIVTQYAAQLAAKADVSDGHLAGVVVSNMNTLAIAVDETSNGWSTQGGAEPSAIVGLGQLAIGLAEASHAGLIPLTPSEEAFFVTKIEDVKAIGIAAGQGGELKSDAVLSLLSANDAISNTGPASATLLIGSSGGDEIVGGGGNDFLVDSLDFSATSNDVLIGGDGNDFILGGAGDDILIAGTRIGSGYQTQDTGDDILFGGQGNDVLSVHLGGDILVGGDGNDSFYLADQEKLFWEDSNNGKPIVIYGGDGQDYYYFDGNNDVSIIYDSNAKESDFLNLDVNKLRMDFDSKYIIINPGVDDKFFLHGDLIQDFDIKEETETFGPSTGYSITSHFFYRELPGYGPSLVYYLEDQIVTESTQKSWHYSKYGFNGAVDTNYVYDFDGNILGFTGFATVYIPDGSGGSSGTDLPKHFLQIEGYTENNFSFEYVGDHYTSETIGTRSVTAVDQTLEYYGNSPDNPIMYEELAWYPELPWYPGVPSRLAVPVGPVPLTGNTVTTNEYDESSYWLKPNNWSTAGKLHVDLSSYQKAGGGPVIDVDPTRPDAPLTSDVPPTNSPSDPATVVRGTPLNDMLGSSGASFYFAGAGSDVIQAGEGSDSLAGQTGNDTLSGAGGSDRYYYLKGDGNDVIQDFSSVAEDSDVLKFLDLNQSGVSLAIDGSDLVVTVESTGETIIIKDQFLPGSLVGIEKIDFADGTSMDRTTIAAAFTSFVGDTGGSTARHTPANNFLRMPTETSGYAIAEDTIAERHSVDFEIGYIPGVEQTAAASDYVQFNGALGISLAGIVANTNYDPADLWFDPEPIGGLV